VVTEPMGGAGWAWVALALYAAGLVLAFGVRIWVQIRITGTSGLRGIAGRPGSLGWWGGVLFPAAVLIGPASPVLVITGSTPSFGPMVHSAVAAIGLSVGVVGLGVVLMAQATMGSSWRIGVDAHERTDLVTSGLFAHVRNPIYTGMAAVAIGVGLMAPTLVALFAVIGLVAAVQIQVRVTEEPYLHRVHGQAYAAYAAVAGRFVPLVGRLSAATAPDSSSGR
jgi:protein-S-isoprenylcysteine O-methyltransferase Ste14